MTIEFALLLGLFIKHFIADFPLQATPWMYRNKGSFIYWDVFPIYPHPGGIAHAGIHSIGTSMVVAGLLTSFGHPQHEILALAQWAAVTDFSLHWAIDFSKVNLTWLLRLKPDNSEWFWILLGFDQLLHAFTYFYIVHTVLL